MLFSPLSHFSTIAHFPAKDMRPPTMSACFVLEYFAHQKE